MRLKNQPSDIVVPRELETEEAVDQFYERLCILSEGSPIDDNMRQIALKEALEVERQVSGVLFL